MVDRRLRSVRIAEDMNRCGVARTAGLASVSFGRVRVAGKGTPIFALADFFRGGDSPRSIAREYRLTEREVLGALRFLMLHPTCDRHGFWKGLPDQMPPEEGS